MNDNQREMLVSCLTQIFGRVEDNFVDQIAPMLRWMELPGGETLFEEGDAEDGIYLVISGRLRAIVREDGGTKIAGEIVQGQTVGEMAVLTHEPRAATIKAIRDSVLAHVSREHFEILTKRHPELTVHIARVIIERLRRSSRRGRPTRPKTRLSARSHRWRRCSRVRRATPSLSRTMGSRIAGDEPADRRAFRRGDGAGDAGRGRCASQADHVAR